METLSIIQSIKSKMKMEFSAQVLAMFLLAFLPTYFGFTKELALIYYFFYSILFIFTSYYFSRFYFFYKICNTINVQNIQDVRWFYHELRLELANYKSFHYITTFIASGFGILYCYFNKVSIIPALNKMELLFPGQVNLFIVCLVFVLILFILTEYAVSWSYRKQLKDLKSYITA